MQASINMQALINSTILKLNQGQMQRQLVPTCSANPMDVIFMVVGRLIVDNQHQVFDVQATSSNGGGHQDIADACLEVVDGALSVRLVLGAMQGQAGVAHLQDGKSVRGSNGRCCGVQERAMARERRGSFGRGKQRVWVAQRLDVQVHEVAAITVRV